MSIHVNIPAHDVMCIEFEVKNVHAKDGSGEWIGISSTGTNGRLTIWGRPNSKGNLLDISNWLERMSIEFHSLADDVNA